MNVYKANLLTQQGTTVTMSDGTRYHKVDCSTTYYDPIQRKHFRVGKCQMVKIEG